jgi:hypothetical protein
VQTSVILCLFVLRSLAGEDSARNLLRTDDSQLAFKQSGQKIIFPSYFLELLGLNPAIENSLEHTIL